MNKQKKYWALFILTIALILVRFFEDRFFDDHLLHFYSYSYLSDALPEVNFSIIYKTISLRYIVNSILSILILSLLFPQKNLIKFLIVFYLVAFIVLSLFLYYEWNNYVPGKYLLLFYVRRMLIHPVFLFILIPALLFHQMENKK
jgi:exosortase F-associated protein